MVRVFSCAIVRSSLTATAGPEADQDHLRSGGQRADSGSAELNTPSGTTRSSAIVRVVVRLGSEGNHASDLRQLPLRRSRGRNRFAPSALAPSSLRPGEGR